MAGKGFRTSPVGGIAAPPYTNGPYTFSEDITFNGNLRKSPGMYYLEEYFLQRPGLNAELSSTATDMPLNRNFELSGTSAVTSNVSFSGTEAGIVLATAGADGDSMAIIPHLDSLQTSWAGIKWGTENQVIWECAIRTGASIATLTIWAGLKLTQTPVVVTDADAAYFRYSTIGADTNWQAITSIANTDVSTDTGVAVAASTTVKFRIEIDSDRKATFYIDDVQVYKSTALTNDIDFIPYIALQSGDGTADGMTVCYEKISRILFE